jgi:hypothetical protein
MYPSQLSRTDYHLHQASERRKLEDAKRHGARPAPGDQLYFEVEDAAKVLNLSPSSVRMLCTRRKLGYVLKRYRHGYFLRRRRLIPKFALVEYMAKHLTYYPPLPQKPKGQP